MTSPFMLTTTAATPTTTQTTHTTTTTTTTTPLNLNSNTQNLNSILYSDSNYRTPSLHTMSQNSLNEGHNNYTLEPPPISKFHNEFKLDNDNNNNNNNNNNLSNISSSTGSSPTSGLMNYSPKHSRKASSLSSNRNMKNLSLNLHSASSSLSSTSSFTSPPNKTGHLPPPPPKKALSISIPDSPTMSISQRDQLKRQLNKAVTTIPIASQTFMDDGALKTPQVTHTPDLPPALQFAYPTKHNDESFQYQFPPASSALDDTPNRNKIKPPPALPFANNNNRMSPLNTPPTLQSPWNSNNNDNNNTSPPYGIATNLSHISISNDNINTSNLTYNSQKFQIPEELQESTQIDAYPNGPKNVLNNQIYLFSDPSFAKNFDIRQYDLIINVAKECKNLSELYGPNIMGQREYLYIPWLHTSSISRDLTTITSKIDEYYTRGKKILIHCQCGVSRSACVVVAYFMRKFQLGVNEAYELLKTGTNNDCSHNEICREIKRQGNFVEGCDRICPNMSLIFELMEFGDALTKKEVRTSTLLMNSPSAMNL
ncbi:CPP1 [[Candida] subhashii]|uniref:protein-tyrosine-phosphatase n=1 Tax=[Candida] subhashii TaxID=561895 RepID=A0A8J5QH43_9ASCO|nr:CPP1 [[Candida] subhashii]KAG7661978.1 CPP1 [[Candida] subhashii]